MYSKCPRVCASQKKSEFVIRSTTIPRQRQGKSKRQIDASREARLRRSFIGRQPTRKYDNRPLLLSRSISHRGGVALGRALGRAMREKKTACDVVTDVRRAAAFQKVRKH